MPIRVKARYITNFESFSWKRFDPIDNIDIKLDKYDNYLSEVRHYFQFFFFKSSFFAAKFKLLTTPLQRIVAGGILVCLAFVTSGVLEIFLEVIVHYCLVGFWISNLMPKTFWLRSKIFDCVQYFQLFLHVSKSQ